MCDGFSLLLNQWWHLGTTLQIHHYWFVRKAGNCIKLSLIRLSLNVQWFATHSRYWMKFTHECTNTRCLKVHSFIMHKGKLLMHWSFCDWAVFAIGQQKAKNLYFIITDRYTNYLVKVVYIAVDTMQYGIFDEIILRCWICCNKP